MYAPTARLPCGAFALDSLDLPSGAERLQGPEFDALRESAAEQGYERETWRLVERNPSDVLFVAQVETGWACITVVRDGDTWQAGQEAEASDLRIVLTPGLGPASWILDSVTQGPDATRLNVLLTEYECASGTSATGRIAPPLVTYGDSTITITFGIVPFAPGGAACQGNPATLAVLELTEPVGERHLLDGGAHPPTVVTAP